MANVYEIVTEQIIAKLEAGTIPWSRPWNCEPARNLKSGKPYRGINTFLLGTQGYPSPFWLSYKQAAAMGANVRRGERATLVTFWNIGQEKTYKKQDGTERTGKSILLRYYNVFNVCQCEHEGQPLVDRLGIGKQLPRVASIAECEAVHAKYPNPPKMEASDKAWFRPATDTVGMPARESFKTPEGFYTTLWHEYAHSTGATHRLGREGIEKLNRFGSELYSKEELVAEMTSAMLAGVAGISAPTLDNAASYIANWLTVLKSDSKMLVSAASAAQKAADYIRGIVGKPLSESETACELPVESPELIEA